MVSFAFEVILIPSPSIIDRFKRINDNMPHTIRGVADTYNFVKKTTIFTGMTPSEVQVQAVSGLQRSLRPHGNRF